MHVTLPDTAAIARVRLDALRRTAASRGERALLVLEDPEPANLAESRVADRERAGDDGSARRRSAPPDRADALAARLGTENGCLVHDLRFRLDPALLAAEAGTVPAGGALILLAPPLDRWTPTTGASRFTVRFARQLLDYLAEQDRTSARSEAVGAVPGEPIARSTVSGPPGGPFGDSSGNPFGDPSRKPVAVVTRTALASQDVSLERLLERLVDGPRALGVVEAPRGHGKSALLGRLAARLERDGIAYRVCAAHRSGLVVFDRHRLLEADERRSLPFVSPDAALADGGEVLLVDEAASLPLPTIERLLERWSRLVLATTSAGYESAGRAFALRLPALLDEARPGWFRITLAEPMRWRTGDPLDVWLRRVLLTDTPSFPDASRADRPSGTSGLEPPPLPGGWHGAPADEVDRDVLIRDEPRLAALYGLLAGTHYQSTPLDLAHLLDGEHIRLWSIERGGVVIGVAMVVIEPGIEPALHADVLARRRRLPHRLLPQLLAQCANRAEALGANVARVVRIAIRPDARRHGLASRLVARLVRDVASEVEAVGASFGESPASVALWSANGFRTFHRGFRRNPRSGRRSLAVLEARTPRVRSVLATAAAVHRDNVAAVIPDAHGALVTAVTDADPRTARAADAALLRRFADGERSLSDTTGAVRRFVARVGEASRERTADAEAEREDGELVRWLMRLGADVPPGRRARERLLRERVAAGLDAVTGPEPDPR